MCHQLGASHVPRLDGGGITPAQSYGHQVRRSQGLTPRYVLSPQHHTASDASVNPPPVSPGFHTLNSHLSHQETCLFPHSPRHLGRAARGLHHSPSFTRAQNPSSPKRQFLAELCSQKPVSWNMGRRACSPLQRTPPPPIPFCSFLA